MTDLGKLPITLALALLLLSYSHPVDVLAQDRSRTQDTTTPQFEVIRDLMAERGWFFRWVAAEECGQRCRGKYQAVDATFSFVARGGYEYSATTITNTWVLYPRVDMSGKNVSGKTIGDRRASCRPNEKCEFESVMDRSSGAKYGFVLTSSGVNLTKVGSGDIYRIEGSARAPSEYASPGYFMFYSNDPEVSASFRCNRCSSGR